MPVGTGKLDSNSVCSVKMSWIPSALFAGQVPHLGTVLGVCLRSYLCHSTSKEIPQGLQLIGTSRWSFRGQDSPITTMGRFGWMLLWLSTSVAAESSKAVAGMSPSSDPCTCIEPLWGPWGSDWADWFICWALYLLVYPLRTRLQSWQGN